MATADRLRQEYRQQRRETAREVLRLALAPRGDLLQSPAHHQVRRMVRAFAKALSHARTGRTIDGLHPLTQVGATALALKHVQDRLACTLLRPWVIDQLVEDAWRAARARKLPADGSDLV